MPRAARRAIWAEEAARAVAGPNPTDSWVHSGEIDGHPFDITAEERKG